MDEAGRIIPQGPQGAGGVRGMIGKPQGQIGRPGPLTPGLSRLHPNSQYNPNVGLNQPPSINFLAAIGTSYAANFDRAPASDVSTTRGREWSDAYDSARPASLATSRGLERSTSEELLPSGSIASSRGASTEIERDLPVWVCLARPKGALAETVCRSSTAFSFMLAQTRGRPITVASDRIKPGALSGFRGLERAIERAVARPLSDAQTRGREDTAYSSKLGGAVINASTRGRSASATREQVRARAIASAYARSRMVDWARQSATAFVMASGLSDSAERATTRILMLAGMKAESITPAESSQISRAIASVRGSERTATSDSDLAAANAIVIGIDRTANWDKSVISSTAALRVNDLTSEYASVRTRATAGVNVLAITTDSGKARAASFSGIMGGEIVTAYDRGSLISKAQLFGRTFTCTVSFGITPTLSIQATAIVTLAQASIARVRIN